MTRKDALRLLRSYNEIKSAADLGNEACIDALIDLETAIKVAKLTDARRHVIQHMCIEGMTSAEYAELCGNEHPRSSRMLLEKAARDVAQVYNMWAQQGDEYTNKEAMAT